MRVYLGSDHAGFELKAKLFNHFLDVGHDPVDCGALEFDPEYEETGAIAEHETK